MTDLDEKVEMALVVIRRSRSIGSHYLFSTNLSLYRDVLSDGEAESRVGRRESEAVSAQKKRVRMK